MLWFTSAYTNTYLPGKQALQMSTIQISTITSPKPHQHAASHPHHPHNLHLCHQHQFSRHQLSRQPSLQPKLRLHPAPLASHRLRQRGTLMPRRRHQRLHPLESRRTDSLHLCSQRRGQYMHVHAGPGAALGDTGKHHQGTDGGFGSARLYDLWECAHFGGQSAGRDGDFDGEFRHRAAL